MQCFFGASFMHLPQVSKSHSAGHQLCGFSRPAAPASGANKAGTRVHNLSRDRAISRGKGGLVMLKGAWKGRVNDI